MVSINRVMAKLRYQTHSSKEESISFFINNLLHRLKLLKTFSSLKTSKVLYLKNKILDIRSKEAQRLISRYNSFAEDTLSDWKDLQQRWFSIKPAEQASEILKCLDSLKEEFESEIIKISEKVSETLHNLSEFDLLYDLSKSESKKVKILEEQIDKIPLMTYKEFRESLKNGVFKKV